MRSNIIKQKQPFGEVHKNNPMPKGFNGPKGQRNAPGSDMHVGNNGVDKHLPINRNPMPGAESMASEHRLDPFYWTAKPGRY
jgi:hypothetical protein